MTDTLYIIGAGGFALQMDDALQREAALGRRMILADDAEIGSGQGLETCRIDDIPPGAEAVIAIARPQTRHAVAERRANLRWGQLWADQVFVSAKAVVEPGSILAHGVVIEAMCYVGAHFQANLYSYVAHECHIGDHVTFAPRVSCNGNVRIGNNVYIGTGAMIRQGRPTAPLVIGNDAFIGMGAVVTRDVPAGAIVKAPAAVY